MIHNDPHLSPEQKRQAHLAMNHNEKVAEQYYVKQTYLEKTQPALQV